MIYLLIDHQDEGIVLAAAHSRAAIRRAARFYTGRSRVAHPEWPGRHDYAGDPQRQGNLLRIVQSAAEDWCSYRLYGGYRRAEDAERVL